MYPASQTRQSVPGHRRQPHDGPLRVLVGKERFSEDHPWSEMPEHWPAPRSAAPWSRWSARGNSNPGWPMGGRPSTWSSRCGRRCQDGPSGPDAGWALAWSGRRSAALQALHLRRRRGIA